METNTFERHPIAWTLAGILAVVAVAFGIWGITIALSPVTRQGNAILAKNDTQNFLEQQAAFQQNFATIKTLDQQLTDAQHNLTAFNQAHPNVGNGTLYDPLAEQQSQMTAVVQGIQNQCRRAANDYNALSHKYLARDFRDAELPAQIDQTDPTFSDGTYRWSDYDCTVTQGE